MGDLGWSENFGVVEASTFKLRKAERFAFRHIRPKSEVQPNLRFSFIFSLNLLKSRVFAILITGTFFPFYRVECACFLATTTCQTIHTDFRAKFGRFFGILKAVTASCDYRLFFAYCEVIFDPFFAKRNNSPFVGTSRTLAKL